MVAAIDALLREIRFEMLKVILLYAFIDATIFFLGFFLLLSIFGMGLFLPLVFSIIVFALDVWWRLRKINLAYVEEQNPHLREILRTAADNKDDESLMAQALFVEVIQKVRRVSSGSFLDFKELGLKLGLLFSLSLVLVGLAFFNVNIQKFENPLAGVAGKFESLLGDVRGNSSLPNVSLDEADERVYGDPRIAKLGKKDLDIKLEQSLSQVDFSKVGEATPSDDQPESYPADVEAKAAEAYTVGLEDINDRKTAAEYSQKVKQG